MDYLRVKYMLSFFLTYYLTTRIHDYKEVGFCSVECCYNKTTAGLPAAVHKSNKSIIKTFFRSLAGL